MPRPTLPALRALAASAACAFLLAACGGGGDDAPAAPAAPPPPANAATVQIGGVAAVGAAIGNATVTVVNKAGARATATTSANGSYTVAAPEGGPYLLSITDAAARTWYSYAQAAGTANITPLTTLAMLQANGNRPLSELAASWSTRQLTAAQVLEAAKLVNANLAQLMQSKGVTATTTNIFTASFAANGQGLDAVLDAMRVSIACSATSCTQTINSPSGTALITWNANAQTNGFTFSWSGSGGASGSVDVGIGSCRAPRAGTYSLVVQTTVAGAVGVSVPEICVDGLPGKPATQSEFCGSATVQQQLPPGVSVISCSYDGTVGTIAARITTPIVIDYTIKYTFVQR